ncbi:hypothetical protein FO519_008681 [Halicephalobus sp. NKZ332]|nr:hypothetical protein FO519_008681 [Halicephalobus sp. NKZ332]
MLHRSPSGAQRKIRQRREEMSKEEPLKEKIAINTFSKPEPARRTLASIDGSNNSSNPNNANNSSNINNSNNINGSIDKYNLPVSSLVETQNSFASQIYGGPGKPTVEVHPMPTPRSSIPSSQPFLSQKITPVPPPIPKKPEKLKKKFDQKNSDFQEEISISVSPNENEFPREKSNIKQDPETSSESAIFLDKSLRCVSKPCSSTEALDRLHTSNLVRSMEEKFDDARLSAADISELEKRRLISINKLINKVTERSADLDAIKAEREAAMLTIQNLLGNHPTRPRIEKEIRMRTHLIQLEGIARVRLQQISSLTKEHAHALQDRVDYWHEKIKDVRYLAIFVSQRIAQIEDEICNFLNKDDFLAYKKCMDLLIELDAENTETEEKLASVQKQIEQLQNICSLPGGNKY